MILVDIFLLHLTTTLPETGHDKYVSDIQGEAAMRIIQLTERSKRTKEGYEN